ncbi:MAG TPA: hypothetical protein VLX92_26425 [Kofleriaceae bacterium]|nr:hypothetical protein [Kofleriaceae bacterium]
MAERRIGARITSGLFLVLVALLMFDIPSSYAFVRGAPWWLALAAGLVVFPALPVTWHVLGERKRKRVRAAAKIPPKSSTTGWERLLFRGGAVAVVVIGGLAFATGGDLFRGMRRHALWLFARDPGSMLSDPALSLVPPDAEAVFWARPTPAMRDAMARIRKDLSDMPDVVVAIRGKHDLLAVERGSTQILEVYASLARMLGVPGDALPRSETLQSGPDGTRWWATPGWRAKVGTGMPVELVDLARRIPGDAVVGVVGRPESTHDADGVRGGYGYARISGSTLEIEGELIMESADDAANLDRDASRAIDDAGHDLKACLREHGGSFDLDHDGDTVTFHGSVDLDDAEELVRCMQE